MKPIGIITFAALLLFIPFSLVAETNLEDIIRELKTSVDVETGRYKKEIRRLTESIHHIWGEEQQQQSLEKLNFILLDLPKPDGDVPPEVHYHALLNGIVDHHLINPIVTGTHSSLLSLGSTGTSKPNREAYNLALTETMSFIENLTEIKNRFLDQAVPLLAEGD